jgi:hypothetical protein
MQETNKQTFNVFIVLLYTTVTIWFQKENINYEVNVRSLWEFPHVPSFHITHIVDKSPQHILLLLQEEFEDTKRVIRIRNHKLTKWWFQHNPYEPFV